MAEDQGLRYGQQLHPMRESPYRPALPEEILLRCREMRTDDTPAEARLWSLLRARRFNGWKFRRQHAVGRFILDFYCHDAGLGVELDGSQHAQPEAAAYDEFRTRLLSRDNIRILRFSNAEVKRHMLRVAEAIWLELNKED